ncbi:MAG TPA: hypothetical protein VFZ40_03500, partial [Pyrinomonadaceae bacterium]
MPFWRRKKDEFVSLGLNTPAAPEPNTAPPPAGPSPPAVAAEPNTPPPPPPAESEAGRIPALPATPWQTSVLGLDLSIEQLQAREAALEQE